MGLTWIPAGASAATIATVLTHPFDAIKVRRKSACRTIHPSAEDGDDDDDMRLINVNRHGCK